MKANFNDIENEAIQKDKDRAQLAENLALQEAKTKEEEEKKMYVFMSCSKYQLVSRLLCMVLTEVGWCV